MSTTPTDAPVTPPARPAPGGPRRSGSWVAPLLTVIGVVVVLSMLVQGVGNVAWAGGRETSGSWTADVDGVTALDVDLDRGSLTVTFDDVSQARLDVEARGWQADSRWTLEVDDGTLVVEDGDRRWGWGWDLGRGEVVAELVLPLELEGRLDADLDLSAGEMDVRGDLREVDLDVSAGTLRFDGASTSLSADVSAGEAIVTTDGPGELALTVSAGRLTATVTGDQPRETALEVSAGHAVLDLPDGDYDLTGQVSAGDRIIDVRTGSGASATLRVDVSAGSAEVGYSD
jgi:hypothetical protein